MSATTVRRRGPHPCVSALEEAEHTSAKQPQCPGEDAGNVDPGAVGGACC